MDALLEQISQESPVALITLSRIFGNIVTSPDNTKYRILKKTSKAMANHVVCSQAAVTLLLAVGFNDCGETLECSMEADLQDMIEVLDKMAALPQSKEDYGSSCAKPMTIVAGTIVPRAGQNGFCATLDTSQQRVMTGEGKAQLRHKEPLTDLQKAQEWWKNQNQSGALLSVESFLEAPDPPALPVPTSTKKNIRSPLDFQDRREPERRRREACQAMQDMRQAQKEKYSRHVVAAC